MIRIFTLLCLALSLSFNSKANTVYTDNGSSNFYYLLPGDSLVIKNGTFKGYVYSWVAGAKITVLQGANFKPAVLSNYVFTLEVYGTAVLPSFSGLAGFSLKNYGNVTVQGSAQMAQAAQSYYNYFGAVLTFSSSFSMNINGGYLWNQGTINVKGDFNINSNSTFINRNIINVDGNSTINSGTMTNMGKFLTLEKLTFNGGNYNNSCRTIAEKGIDIGNTSTVDNDGLLWASNAKSNANFTNSGTITGRPNSQIKSKNLTNWGTIKGSGFLYFTGTTIGGGTVGVPGTTSDTLKIFDMTRTSSNKIFDTHNSNVKGNAIFFAFAGPDTINMYPKCASEIVGIALPVKYNYFHVNLANNTPALSWSADHNDNAEFTLERSYDGITFTAIAVLFAIDNETKFTYNDKTVAEGTKVAYYRVVGTEPGLAPKISETRSVKFTSNTGVTIQPLPNPFTSHFSINYESAARSTIQVRIYNMNGQVQAAKQATVSAGFNSIAVPEAAKLAKGMYVVQVTDGNSVIATEKIIKN